MNIRPDHEWDLFEGLTTAEDTSDVLARVPFARDGERRLQAARSPCRPN